MVPVYGYNQRPAAVVAAKINSELLPAARELLRLLISAGIEWTANGMSEKMATAEAEGETTLEGWDTNDLRCINQVFNGFMIYLNTPQQILQRDGSTAVMKPQDVIMQYYHQQQV